MSFDLAISRVAALAMFAEDEGNPSPIPHMDNLEIRFRGLVDAIRDDRLLQDLDRAIMIATDNGGRKSTEIHEPSFEDDDGLVDIFLAPDQQISGNPVPIVALLPSRRVRCQVEGIEWILRTRATVTACALQTCRQATKLWWTFEGIPGVPTEEGRPSERQVASFLAMVEGIEKAALSSLFTCYRNALVKQGVDRELTRSEREIKVVMSENDDDKYAFLLEEMMVRTGRILAI